RKNYDMCIVFHDSDPCPVEAAYAAGVPFIFRIGQKDEKCSHLLTFRVPYDNSKHAIDQRLEVLRRIFGTRLNDEDDFRMDIPVSPELVAHYRNLLEERAGLGPGARPRFVAFQFSASGFYKEWPQGNFVELGKALIERDPGIFVVLIGGKGDRARAREIESAIKGATGKDRVLDLTGAIPIGELPAAMKAIDLLVTNDTGPLHVAIAVGTRTVSLFVSTNVEGTGPIQDRHLHTVMVKPKPCSPCVEKYCKDPHCMGLISPQEVYEAVVDSLKRLSDEGPSI
ncbi:MAG: glycosyltransferase family 9 protein, partial [Thermodesulfobacteria bacterium]|nr:glycosyltransferase family 9 protein [Thermodesulfobacteriota bacterium]